MDYSQISDIGMMVSDRIKRARNWLFESRICGAADVAAGEQVARLKQENDRLRRELKRLSDFLDTSSDVVWETNDRLAITTSNADLQLPTDHIGLKLVEALGINPLSSQRWIGHLQSLAGRQPFRGFELSVHQSDGCEVWLEINGNPTFARGRFQGYRGTCRNVTERKRYEAQIAFMANHDPLTRLANRAQFHELTTQALVTSGRQESIAVLCLDLDGFKNVNDTLGHGVGDLLLLAVADRLRSCAEQTDVVARLGGDEFAILRADTAGREEACQLAERILTAINEPYLIDGHRVVVGTSIGINVAARSETKIDSLIKNADVALYQSKADGRGTYRVFQSEMNIRLQERRALEVDLRAALELGQFELFYQPIVNIASKQIVAFEALLRWNHPKKGMISPATFIPLAEETSLIVPIGDWVLQQACRDAVSWSNNIKVAVNLSPVQFKRGALEMSVTRALAGTGLHGSRLELEITESILLQDEATTRDTLNNLRVLGVKIAIDDFGTGYSALSYLRNFPLDKIKIDQSFIRDLSEKGNAAPIVRAISELGTALDMTIVAEGVETAEQLMILGDQRCTEAQGYFIARPQPAAQLLHGSRAVA
ncbi:EAL domain-containing protein [Bradyrhizobium diazoefficiens]|uniref:putative bifunctional diguanylate cyclase/phosphodiesterase n=1 Tax=Bradyrhizobium diazoefficiens TaxID=1355477 RepID=UPI00190E2722|nr:EAL domain-containing protein [Bradyrhizobium diazoefficiens]MBK3666282.1 EAL domain-containing protein [Bradyrhizobium diazoefficiens]